MNEKSGEQIAIVKNWNFQLEKEIKITETLVNFGSVENLNV